MNISMTENAFILSSINASKLYFMIGDERYSLHQNEQTFELNLELLSAINIEQNAPFEIYADDVPLRYDDNTNFESGLKLIDGDNFYYIFVNAERHIAVIKNKKPSILLYHDKNVQFVNSEVIDNKMLVTLQFTTTVFPAKNGMLYLTKRGKDDVIKIKSSDVSIEKSNDQYRNLITFTLTLKHLTPWINAASPNDMNKEIFDVSFNYQIDAYDLSRYKIRVKFNGNVKEAYSDENWFSRKSDQVLVETYATAYQNLSIRINRVKKEVYEAYKNIKIKTKTNHKPVILCIEYPEKAQDNAFIMFEYLQRYRKDWEVYYLITEDSPDRIHLDPYKDKVVIFKSPEHIALLQNVDLIIHTHTSKYSLPFFTNYLEELLLKKRRIFLQHGITMTTYVAHIYSKYCEEQFTDKIIASSEVEASLLKNHYQYDDSDIVITGLARFDELIKFRKQWIKQFKNRKKIIIMPTWRRSLHQRSDEDFLASDYFKALYTLIHHRDLEDLICNQNYEVNLYLHRNLQKFSHLFESEHINILTQEDATIKSLLHDHAVMITDYSSVGLDFALMRKKVIYYRPEKMNHEDMKQEPDGFLPGVIASSSDEVMKLLKSPIERNDLSHLYGYSDQNAKRRITVEIEKLLKINK